MNYLSSCFLFFIILSFFCPEKAFSFTSKVQWESDAKRFRVQVKDPSLKRTSYDVSGTSFEIPVPNPGKYEWRVRALISNEKTKYSKWATLIVKDAIFSYKKPLMETPRDGVEIENSEENTDLELKYNRPSESWTYHLEVYEDGILKVNETLSGDSFKYKLPLSSNEIKWKVSGRNKLGHETKNQDFWSLYPSHSKALEKRHHLFYEFALARFELEQNFNRTSIGQGEYSDVFMLQKHGVKYRYSPRSRIFQNFEVGFYYLTPLTFSDEFSSFKFEARLKTYLGSSRKHRILTELDRTQLSYRLDNTFDADQILNFISLGLESDLNLISSKLNGALLLTRSLSSSNNPLGYRGRLHYKITEKTQLNLLYELGNANPDFEINGEMSKSETTTHQLEFGLSYLFL